MRPFLSALLFLLPLSLFAAEPWDAPPFTADPKAMSEAAAKIASPANADLVILINELRWTFDENGGARTESHVVMRILTDRAVEGTSVASASWSPWYQERPQIKARVVTKDGAVHALDPQSVVDATAQERPDMFSDARVVRAPLPGIAVGSIIETLITVTSKSAFPAAGQGGSYTFGDEVPVERARLIIDAPLSLTPHIANHSTLQPRSVEADGRRQTIFESGHTDAVENVELFLPPDVRPLPYVGFSTGASWQEIARQYGAIVDRQIAAGDVSGVAALTGGATDAPAIAARLLAYVQRNVHYAGVEVGDGSIVPRTPKSVLTNKFGDCKDKATLLVALLRAAGLQANVALLSAGFDADAAEELPAVSDFNHAIVVVGGATPIWIDPTDEFARAGELPFEDRGRLALIADAKTTGLTKTPDLPSSANRSIEERRFTLPEEGNATVTEVTRGEGGIDARIRRGMSEAKQPDFDNELKDYGNRYYFAKKTSVRKPSDPRDLAKPFETIIDVTESRSGVIRNGSGSVVINLGDLFTGLPPTMRDYHELAAGESPSATEKKRVHDFQFPFPTIKEWRYRIVPAPGFRARALPPAATKQLGTATLTETFETAADGAVLATLLFDSGKRRITAAEYETTRAAVSRTANGDSLSINFESAGQQKLNAGDIRGALDEFRRLTTVHPKEAQHHLDVARALLAGGLGDAARDEARAAVKIEPSSAHAHAMLAWILEHDLLGRHFHRGFDLAGAIAERQTAKKLEPTEFENRYGLSTDLAYGDDGVPFGHNARVADAINELEGIMKDFEQEGPRVEGELMLAMADAGRWSDVERHVETLRDARQQQFFRIIVAAGKNGSAAAMHELDRYDDELRRQLAASAGSTLVMFRRYADAAAMYEVATNGKGDSPQMQRLIVALRTAGTDRTAGDTPQALVYRLVRAMIMRDTAAMKKLVPHAQPDDFNDLHVPSTFPGVQGVSPSTVADIICALVEVRTDGDETLGYRLRAHMGSTDLMTVYVHRENGAYVIAATGDKQRSVGDAALRLVDAGQLDAARTWLNWARERVGTRSGDEPLDTTPPFAALWPKEKPTATADEIRLAAAAIADPKIGVPILLAAREQAPDERKMWIDSALVDRYQAAREFSNMLPVAERLAKSHPQSEIVFILRTAALFGTGDLAFAETLAKERLRTFPHDMQASEMLFSAAARRRDFAGAAALNAHIIDDLTPAENDYNNAAWLALFTGKDFDKAIEFARKATATPRIGRAHSGRLHTLAALYAATGKTVEARDVLLKSLDARGADALGSSDWYVLGLIAENYGVRDFALNAYKRVEKDPIDSGLMTYDLAQRRLEAMK